MSTPLTNTNTKPQIHPAIALSFWNTTLAILLFCANAQIRAGAVETESDMPSQISAASIFYQKLMWVGTTAPADEESRRLWTELQQMKKGGIDPTLPALEEFISTYTNSPWAPSLHANMGRYYREHGRYSLALKHWELAWKATRNEKEGSGKKVADFTFAYWTSLLASLGRTDTLKALFNETEERTFDSGPLQQVVNSTREGYHLMLTEPGECFKCGTYALNNVARVLKGARFDSRSLITIPSPTSGFTMDRLMQLAEGLRLELVPVEWTEKKMLVIPSLVHWKENHYAAILEEKRGRYLVIDPTFGQPRWLKAEEILDEASGHFLVPKDKLPDGWRTLSSAETKEIVGRGRVSGVTDSTDGCGNGSGGGSGGGDGSTRPDSMTNDGGCNDCAGVGPPVGGGGPGGGRPGGGGPGGGRPGGGGPGGGGAGCDGCPDQGSQGGNAEPSGDDSGNNGISGMPNWEVSEPYINLWLYDEPLGYRPGLGTRVSFKLAYKQRESRTISEHWFSLGPMWNCSWLTYISLGGTGDLYPDMVVAGGGKRHYDADTEAIDYYSQTKLHAIVNQAQNVTGYMLSYNSGARDYYSFIPTVLLDAQRVALLTEKVDRFGHTNRFIYQETNSVVFLRYVIDGDGRTNALSYTNTAYPAQITGVQDPFGRATVLQYSATGVLTNVIDVAGLTNSFKYDYQGWVTNLVTPYGTTTFQYSTNSQTSSDEFHTLNDYALIRSVKIIDPMGGTNIFMLRQDSSLLYTNQTDWVSFLPNSYPSSVVPSGVPTTTLDNVLLYYRDTFHWGPRQATGLPLDMTIFTPANYRRARMRHWLHDRYTGQLGQTLDMEQAPSPDGTVDGQTTWYDYDGKTETWLEGSSSQPALVARVIPDGTTQYVWYRRDELGRPTNIVQTYSTGHGSVIHTRTNINVYDGNGVDLVKIIGPRGETLAGMAYNAQHQLLRLTNALSDVEYRGYDAQGRLTAVTNFAGLATTNIYFSGGQYSNWVQIRIDLQINRTNLYLYNNDLLFIHTNELGLITTNLYDNLQRLTNTADSRGSIAYIYDKLDLVRIVDRLGLADSFAYDNLRRLVAKTNALDFYTVYSYCTCGSLDSTRDAEGHYTYFFYDNAGRLINTAYPDGFGVTNRYNLIGQITNTINSAGTSLTNWFDNQGLRYAISNVFGCLQYTAFDQEDRATNTIDASGLSLINTYDDLNRLRIRIYPDTGAEKFGYSARGLIAYTNQLNFTNFYAYDEARRKILETNANWEVTQFRYNAAGNLTNLLDGKSQSTRWNFDQFGRMTNKLDNLGTDLLRYSYDASDRLTNRASAAKGTTAYRYDGAGNLTNVVYPVTSNLVFAFNALRQITNMVTSGTLTNRYTYDSVGLVLSEDGPWDDDVVSYSYNNRRRMGLSLMKPNASPWIQSYDYDGADRLTDLASPAGHFSYSYDPTRNPLVRKLILPNGAYVTNYYDSVARLLSTALKNSGNGEINAHGYTFDLAGERSRQIRTDGNYIDYTYDKIGQVQTALGREPGGVTNRANEWFAYAYDPAGNLLNRSRNDTLNAFSVNSLNELTTETNFGTLTVVGTTTSPATNVTVNGLAAALYVDATFAKAGMTFTSGNNSYTAIAKDGYGRSDTNVVTVDLPTTNNFVYDLNGNLRTNGTRSFDYDDENQLIRITEANTWKSEFVYDGKMRRRLRFESTWTGSTWVTNEITKYVYDANLVIQERDGNNVPTVTYTRGHDLRGSFEGAGGIGGLLARTANALFNLPVPTTNTYYHCDGDGNISVLITTNQVVAARYLYDPFGGIVSESGPLARNNLYRFSSKEFHINSGLVNYLYRYYEPAIQKWINRDPLGDVGFSTVRDPKAHGFAQFGSAIEILEGSNPYGFVRNHPVGAYDSYGLSCATEAAKCGTALAAAILSCKNLNPIACQIALASAAATCTSAEEQCRVLERLRRLGPGCHYAWSPPSDINAPVINIPPPSPPAPPPPPSAPPNWLFGSPVLNRT